MELDPEKVKDFLTREEYGLYKMIWDRFVGSQMKPALFDVTDADITVGNLTLRASGEVRKFAGFLAVFEDAPGEDDDEDAEKKNDKALPPLNEGDILKLIELETKQNFTQPPPRFTEATLVKALEENGIGRPSTYGSILTTIQARDYTYKHEGKFHPTHLGALVVKLLKQSFADIIDEGYTAELEQKLDEVEDGTLEWTDALRAFSVKFNSDLERAGTEMTQVKGTGLETDEKCETCGSPMVIKFGRFGEFLACSNYPECKTTKEMPKGDAAEATSEDEQIICDKCGKPMQLKRSRFGQFFACTGYPDCKNTKDPKLMKQAANLPTEPQPPCENCGKEMVLKSGRYGPVLLMRRLSGLQDHSQDRPQGQPCEADRREVPDLQRGRAGRAHLTARCLLLVQPLPEVRVHAQQSPRRPRVPEVPRPVSPRKGDQARRPHRVLQQPRVRLPRPDRGARGGERVTVGIEDVRMALTPAVRLTTPRSCRRPLIRLRHLLPSHEGRRLLATRSSRDRR